MEPASDISQLSDVEVRSELVTILDRLAELGDQDFATRAPLLNRQASLRARLTELAAPGAGAIKAGWAERAGNKPSEQPPLPQIPYIPEATS